MINIKTSTKIIEKDGELIKIEWIEKHYPNLLSNPLKDLSRITAVNLKATSKIFKCINCNQETENVFSFLKRKRIERIKFHKWPKFCFNCSCKIIPILNCSDEVKELFSIFIFKNQK